MRKLSYFVLFVSLIALATPMACTEKPNGPPPPVPVSQVGPDGTVLPPGTQPPPPNSGPYSPPVPATNNNIDSSDGAPILPAAEAVAKADCPNFCQKCKQIVECKASPEKTVEECLDNCERICVEQRIPTKLKKCFDDASTCEKIKACLEAVSQ